MAIKSKGHAKNYASNRREKKKRLALDQVSAFTRAAFLSALSGAGCLRPPARAGEHAGAGQESGAVAWALGLATSVGEVVLARGRSFAAFGKEVEGAPLGPELLGPRSGHPTALKRTQGEA